MNRRLTIVLCLVVVAGASSFLLGRQTAGPEATPAELAGATDGEPCCKHSALCNFLRLSAEQRKLVRATDPDFADEAGRLKGIVQADRQALAVMLENPESTDEQIMAQIEKVIASHDALERHVARHMLAIRPILTPEQAKQLMGLAASGVRSAGRCGLQPLGQQGRQGCGGGPPQKGQ